MSLSEEKFAKGYLVYAFIRGLNFVIENDIKQTLKEVELTFPGFRILWILYFHTTIKMTELTYLAQANMSNVFRQLTKLKEDGLVVIENGHDARTKKISLTTEGREHVRHFLDKNKTNSDLEIVQLIEKVPEEDLSTFIKVSSFLSTELIGQPFSDFVTESTADILNPTPPTIE